MKKIKTSVFAFLAMIVFTTMSYAQDGLDIDIDLGKSKWYDNPLYVIIGGLVFLLLLGLIFRARKK